MTPSAPPRSGVQYARCIRQRIDKPEDAMSKGLDKKKEAKKKKAEGDEIV